MLEEIRADLRSEPGKPASVKQAKEETAEVEQPDNVTVWHSVATRSEDTTHKATTVYSSEGESVSEEDTNNNEQAVEENNYRFHWRRWEETSSWARSSASDGKEGPSDSKSGYNQDWHNWTERDHSWQGGYHRKWY